MPLIGNVSIGLLVLCLAMLPGRALAAKNDCAQPVTSGESPAASDALFVLGTSVGLQFCKRCVCDVDASGATTASDALVTLNAAVGNPANLACNSCGPPVTLECEAEGYPCSFADADPEALDRSFVLLGELHGIRDSGTMADVRAYLESQPDVIDVNGDDSALRFIVDGATPAFFLDISGLTPPDATLAFDGHSHSGKIDAHGDAVVGEDSTGDGVVDNHDDKRALVLAPYEWQFGAFDESEEIATILGNLPAYEDRVRFRRNAVKPPEEANGQITIHDYLNWEDYDVVYLATHGMRACWNDEPATPCFVVIDTGTYWNWQDLGRPIFAIPGKYALSNWPSEDESIFSFKLGLTTDFFRGWYNSGLDNALVVLAACETGDDRGSELAEAMGGDDFVMMGWSEAVDSDVAFDAATLIFEAGVEGRTVGDGLNDVENAGLSPYVNSRGDVNSFQAFTPQPVDLRIIELPRLMFEGQEMYDGADISELVASGSGSSGGDTVALTLQVTGVTPETKDAFSIRYRVNDMGTVGTYNLDASSPVVVGGTTYEVEHQVDLGFPLPASAFPIEVIVDLPEGGDSRFSVEVTAAPCGFTATLSGEQTGIWDGSAHLIFEQDGSICIDVSSSGGPPGDFSDTMQGGVCSPPGTAVAPGTSAVAIGRVGVIQPFYSATYFNQDYFGGMDLEDADCGAACGGTVTFDEIDDTRARGSFEVTMPRSDNDGMPMPSVTLTASFNAVPGSVFAGTSPIVRCRVALGE